MFTALGTMSGTSMDGIDLALIRSDGKDRVEPVAYGFTEYPSSVRRLLKQALEDATELEDRDARPRCLKQAEELITELHAVAVADFLAKQKIEVEAIEVLGFHGQTVLHRPADGLTVQLGDGEMLARVTGITTVYDMRANDMVHGGQGAPLVPVYHRALAAPLLKEVVSVAFVNIGGISNLTYVDERNLIAFDCGPGNALIDQWVQAHAGIPFDQGGTIAQEGSVDTAYVNKMLRMPFFSQSGPKSLDRNDFSPPEPDQFDLETGARTLANLAAAAIAKSAEILPTVPALWVISGGGRLNPFIIADLRRFLEAAHVKVCLAEDVDLNGDMMEAEAWAYLAVRAFKGLALTYPATTGCSKPVTGGVIAEPTYHCD